MKTLIIIPLALLCLPLPCAAAGPPAAPDLWELGRDKRAVHRFSTLFTAQDVRDHLATEDGLKAAVSWCRQTGVTKVYVESFRDGYQAPRELLTRARDRFRAEGLDVAGCVTTTRVGKRSTGWAPISCYTDAATQDRLQKIFEYTAGLFDEIMIDDFWFTDCTCAECEAARKARTVTVGAHKYPTAGDGWADYRGELMVRLSRERVLEPARRVNPGVKVIIKYPQWYDRFHERGYDVERETADFDRIWVGTETRDYDDRRWGGHRPVRGLFPDALAGRHRRAEVRRRLVRPVRHHGTDLCRAGPPDGPGGGARVAAVLLRLPAAGHRAEERRRAAGRGAGAAVRGRARRQAPGGRDRGVQASRQRPGRRAARV
jgi:hypothetical protein